MQWLHKGKPMFSHDEFTADVVGFIYELSYSNGQKYIGKRELYSTNIIPAKKSLQLRDGAERVYRNILKDEDGKICASKKSKAQARKKGLKATRTPYDKIVSPKGFADYEGSHKTAKGLTLVKKEIIELCSSKIDLTYSEVKWMFRFDVLFNDVYINDNIGGLYYDGKIVKGL